jgi:hypothetical protein
MAPISSGSGNAVLTSQTRDNLEASPLSQRPSCVYCCTYYPSYAIDLISSVTAFTLSDDAASYNYNAETLLLNKY